MVFGITPTEMLIIVVVAAFVLGPERMPEYAAKLRSAVRELRRMAVGAKEQLREQMGPDFDDIDWKAYDPRQYDPRRIVREALLEDDPVTTSTGRATAEADDGVSARDGDASGRGGATAVRPHEPRRVHRPVPYDPAMPTPFDPEAT